MQLDLNLVHPRPSGRDGVQERGQSGPFTALAIDLEDVDRPVFVAERSDHGLERFAFPVLSFFAIDAKAPSVERGEVVPKKGANGGIKRVGLAPQQLVDGHFELN